MRIWNLPCSELDLQHLLGEHFELHVMWSALTGRKRGWRNHPETRRFEGRLRTLYNRHAEQVAELHARGHFGHRSELDAGLIPPEDSAEWPPTTAERVEQDRLDLAAHTPGWRKRAAQGDPPPDPAPAPDKRPT